MVVGDLRLSLSISAKVARIPYASLINAYWSPYAVRDGFPLPDHPIVELLGVKLASRFFPLAAPLAFARFAAPINTVRRRYGLSAIGGLPEVLCYGDHTLYADPPELYPMRSLPGSHRFLGAVPWSPRVELPQRVEELLRSEQRFVYVTLGSSGRVKLLGVVLDALAGLGLRALVATAGRLPAAELAHLPASACVTDYLPGDVAARAAEFVVTNGGSSTGYQALAAGRPVLGIPSNLDHYLATDAIVRAGAGVSVRAGTLTTSSVRGAAEQLLQRAELHERAAELAQVFARTDCHQRFQDFLSHALERRQHDAIAS
jgi:UDP:flavonoid glycosyltransferase YjiC (YdhE family)